MSRPLPVPGPQAQPFDLPFVCNIFHTSFHTQRARYIYTERSNGRLTWDVYQQETLSIMTQVVYRGQTLDWVPVVVSVFDGPSAVMETLRPTTRPSDGAFRVQGLEVRWKTDGTETIAGMPGNTRTKVCQHNLAAILHKLKQRSGLDSIVVTIVDAPVPVIDLTLEDSPEAATPEVPIGTRNNSSSSTESAAQDRPAQSKRPPNKARKVSTASTSQDVAKLTPTSASNDIEGGESAGDSNQAPILREQPSTLEVPESSKITGSKDTEQRTAPKRKRQTSPFSGPNELSRQTISMPSVEGRDKRPYDPVRDMAA